MDAGHSIKAIKALESVLSGAAFAKLMKGVNVWGSWEAVAKQEVWKEKGSDD